MVVKKTKEYRAMLYGSGLPATANLACTSNNNLVRALTGSATNELENFTTLREWAEQGEIGRIIMELSCRVMLETLQRNDCLHSSAITRNYLRARLRPYTREVFLCLFLDNQNRTIAVEELFFGTIDGATVHPRIVVEYAIKHNAASILLAHNHPSGVAEPSQADIGITRRLKNALGLIDIRVLDHFVIGDLECVSLAERGLI